MQIITNMINLCQTCQISKPENHTVKLPFEKADTPKEPRIHYHMDIWEPESGESYLTCIDKFSKYAITEPIENRNHVTLLNAMLKIFNYMGKPKIITVDNEGALKSEYFSKFLEENNIQTHFTTPHRHTGNSDIERLHATLNT